MRKVRSNKEKGEARDYSRASMEICWRLEPILIQILYLAQSRTRILFSFESLLNTFRIFNQVSPGINKPRLFSRKAFQAAI